MNLNSKKSLFRILAFLLLFTTYLPVIYNRLPPIIGSHHLFVAIWVVALILFYPVLFKNKLFLFLLFYGLFFIVFLTQTLWFRMDSWNKRNLLNELYILTVALSIFLYFFISKDFKGLAIIVKWTMVLFLVTNIMTIYSSIINPMYARMMTGGQLDLSEMELFKKLGGGGYGFASALIALVPMMVYYYRNKKISIFSKKLIIIFGVLSFLALFRMQIFANIIIGVLTLFISLLGNRRLKYSLFFVSIALLIISILPDNLYSNLLKGSSSYFDTGSETYYKLNDMSQFLITDDYENTAAGSRAARFPMLLETFISNPVFGSSVSNESKYIGAGAHLYWMNKLAILGLFGFLPFIYFHYRYIKTNINMFNQEFTFYYLIAVFSIIGLGLVKNLAGRELWFTYFVILPGMYYLPLLKKKSNI